MGPPLPRTQPALGTPSAAVERIDLSNPDEGALAKLVRQACVDAGFFYVVNHGVDPDLMKELFHQSKKFFSLPLDEKMKTLHDGNFKGYSPYLEEVLANEVNQAKGDMKEGFYMGEEIPPDDVRLPLNTPNLWPSPDVLPQWRETMLKYREAMLLLAGRLSRLLALALGLDAEYFNKPSKADQPQAFLRLLKYPAEKSYPEQGLVGTGAHTDWGMFTILANDSVPGLQICKDKDANPQVWMDVPPMEGAFVVNLGDMLERWTNDLFRSTLHRVVNPGYERYSVAFFVTPNYNCVVKCLPTCRNKEKPAKYSPTVSVEYLLRRYARARVYETSEPRAVLLEA